MRRVHFILYVADQERSRDFYTEVLGRGPELDVPGMTEFRLQENAVLGIMPRASIERLLDGRVTAAGIGSRCELYLVVSDAEAYHRRALAAGAIELSPFEDRDWHQKVAYSADPDGHVLAMASEIE